MRATDIQRLYLQAAQQHCAHQDAETDWVLHAWDEVLNHLETDPNCLADRLDWVAKRHLLELFMESEQIAWGDPALLALDLEYHNIEPSEGLYYGLIQQGQMRTLVSEAEIEQAIYQPPVDTRAFIRGLCVQRFADQIQTLNWERIILHDCHQSVRLDLSRLVDGQVQALNRQLSNVGDLTTFVRLIQPIFATQQEQEFGTVRENELEGG